MRLTVLTVTLMSLFVSPAQGRTIHVPLDYATVGEAVAVAVDGDVIDISCGVFSVVDIVIDHDLSIRSTSGDWECVTLDAGGAGRHFEVNANVDLQGLKFIGGRVPDSATLTAGGALVVAGSASVSASNCRFRANYAPWRGGAVYLHPGAGLSLEGCDLVDNSIGFNALNGPHAGGIFSEKGSITAIGCTFIRNIAGAGLYNNSSGAAVMSNFGPATFIDCLFANNVASGGPNSYGGAVWGQVSALAFAGCTFVGNSGSNGGAVHVNSSPTLDIAQCVIVGNTSDNGAVSCVNGPVQIACSDIYGNAGGDYVGCASFFENVNGNTSTDPLFCDSANGNYYLQWGSPCLASNSGGCGRIGVFGPGGCNSVSISRSSWGTIKARYR